MHYDAYISREGRHILATFPDCPGCQTFAESSDEIAAAARDALEGWLEAHLLDGQVPPRPVGRATAPKGAKLARIPVRAGLAAALNIRWARQDAGLSQKELGRLAGVSQQQIAKLEDPDENPSLETLSRVGAALGLQVHVGFERGDHVAVPAPSSTRSSAARSSSRARRAR